MLVVIPIDSESETITRVSEAKEFAFVHLGEGMQIEKIEKYPSFANQLFDYIVTPDKDEDLEGAYELGARALLARDGMSIDEVVEAMIFRELDEIV